MIIGLVGSDSNRVACEHALTGLQGQSLFHVSLGLGGFGDGSTVPESFWAGIINCRSQLGVVYVRDDQTAFDLRMKGGVNWHLLGFPSRDIILRHGDVMVSMDPAKAAGHRLSIEEAFSDLISRSWEK